MKKSHNFWTGSGLILLAAACFGFQSSLVKKLFLLGSNPFQVLFYELALASLLLGAACFVRRKKLGAMSLRGLGRVLLWGAIGVGGTGLALYGAVQRIPVALAIVLLFYYVPVVFLLEFVFLKIRPSGRRWGALLMILVGTILATDVLAVTWANLDFIGVSLGLVSGVCYGTFIFAARRLGTIGTPLGRSFIICAGTCCCFVVGGVFWPAVVFVPPDGAFGVFFLLIVVVTIMGQVIPLLAFSRAIPLIGGSLAAIVASVELPVASLVAFFLLGEHLHLVQWSGILLISLAVVVANWRQRELAKISTSSM